MSFHLFILLPPFHGVNQPGAAEKLSAGALIQGSKILSLQQTSIAKPVPAGLNKLYK
jgi:hypothetical protein